MTDLTDAKIFNPFAINQYIHYYIGMKGKSIWPKKKKFLNNIFFSNIYYSSEQLNKKMVTKMNNIFFDR